MIFDIEHIDCDVLKAADRALVDGLAEVLVSCVNSGASVGYFAPLPYAVARRYWHDTLADCCSGERELWIARCGETVVGTVQLQGSSKTNGRHRAELQRLLVHVDWRRRGIASALLRATEQWAKEQGRSLLVLDTKVGDGGEQLYRNEGWLRAGEIPGWTRTPRGQPEATAIFWKNLEAEKPPQQRRTLRAI